MQGMGKSAAVHNHASQGRDQGRENGPVDFQRGNVVIDGRDTSEGIGKCDLRKVEIHKKTVTWTCGKDTSS